MFNQDRLPVYNNEEYESLNDVIEAAHGSIEFFEDSMLRTEIVENIFGKKMPSNSFNLAKIKHAQIVIKRIQSGNISSLEQMSKYNGKLYISKEYKRMNDKRKEDDDNFNDDNFNDGDSKELKLKF